MGGAKKNRSTTFMSWETRKGQRYYYRKERDGKRVRSVYAGKDERAALMADIDALCRLRDEEERRQARAECRGEEEIDASIKRVSALVSLLAEATLITEGYHAHKRQWRKRRDGGKGQETL